MQRIGAFVAALVAMTSLGAAASEEGFVQVAFLHPHRPAVLNDDARALFIDVNAARARKGLVPLAPDEKLSQFALQVAEQMAMRHYFGHTNPDGITFEDRLRTFGLQYRYAAENLALDQDEPHAHAAFLRSPGHYANIVDTHPRRLGVAAVSAGEGEIFYVEEFSD